MAKSAQDFKNRGPGMQRTWSDALWPADAPLWLVIAGHTSLAIVIGSITVMLLPYSLVSRIKVLKWIRSKVRKFLERILYLSSQGPFYRVFAWFGKRCGCGYCSSRCQPPMTLRIKATGCTEAVFYWNGRLPLNPFHEEKHIVEWKRADTADNALAWKEVAATGKDCGFEDMGEGKKLKWRVFLTDLPESTTIKVRCRAWNRRGLGPWSEEVACELLVKPSKGDGGWGPLNQTQAPNGSGAGAHFHWTQEPHQLGIKVPLPDTVKAKDVKFKVTTTRLEIRYVLKEGEEPQDLLVGKLFKTVIVDDVDWQISEDKECGRHVEILMKKDKKLEKWPCLLEEKGHPRIDTAKVQFFTGKDPSDPYGGMFDNMDIFD